MTNSDLLQYANKYVDKLEKLIQQGETLYESFMEIEELIIYQELRGIDNYDDDSMYMTSKLNEDKAALWKWQKQCRNVLEQLPIKGTIYEHILDEMLEIDFKNVKGVRIQELTIDLEALKEDYQEGFLDSLMLQAEGEVLCDYLLQAKQFFDDKYYAAAALLAVSTLEFSLKKLCDRKISEERKKEMKIENFFTIPLKKVSNYAKGNNLIDKRTSDEINDKIVPLRNKVAHGDLEIFNPDSEESKETVRELLIKIEGYIERYMR
jgi:hypothetical protein